MTTEFHVETVEDLEGQLAVLRGRIARAVGQASAGQSDGAEIPALTREVPALSARIAVANDEEDRARAQRQRAEDDKARAELDITLPAAAEQRDRFLKHYRAACVALGSYLRSRTRAGELPRQLSTQFGPMPEHMTALRELELGSKPAESVGDLRPDTGEGWRLSFAVTPMHSRIQRTGE